MMGRVSKVGMQRRKGRLEECPPVAISYRSSPSQFRSSEAKNGGPWASANLGSCL